MYFEEEFEGIFVEPPARRHEAFIENACDLQPHTTPIYIPALFTEKNFTTKPRLMATMPQPRMYFEKQFEREIRDLLIGFHGSLQKT